MQILINSGNGQWKWYLTSSSGVVGLGRLGWGDINGDGYYDVVVAGTTYPKTLAGRELPPWVWAAILGVVCLLALLAGLFGR